MKKIVSLILGIGLLSMVTANAAWEQFTLTTADSSQSLITNRSVSISAATIVGSDQAVNNQIQFYDIDTNNTTLYTNLTNVILGAYVTRTSTYSTNLTSVYTNVAGIVTTNTYSGLNTVLTTNAASTDEKAPALVLIVPGSSAITDFTDLGINLTDGLVVHATTNSTLLLSTTPLR